MSTLTGSLKSVAIGVGNGLKTLGGKIAREFSQVSSVR